MSLSARIEEINDAHRSAVLSLLWVRFLWMSISGLALLIVADWLFIFADSQRMMLDIIVVLVIWVVLIKSYWGLRRSLSQQRMLVRMLEEHDPTLHNDLVNALDFEEALKEGMKEGLSPLLAEEVVRLAESRFEAEPDYDALEPATYRREKKTLLVLIITSMCLSAFFWGALTTILPRIFLPFGDYPPYGPTQFTVDPGDITVDYGENLVVSLVTHGEIPKGVMLVLRNVETGKEDEFPMFDAGEGNFYQTIEQIHEEIDYFARIPRGRSKRYRVDVTTLPRIESVVVTYYYPEYTHLEPRSHTLLDEAIKGYIGTRVELKVASNRPLKGGSLDVDGTGYTFNTAEEDSVTMTFTIEQAGQVVAHVEDVAGKVSTETVEAKVEIIEDEKPEIVFASPGMDSFAVVDSEMDLQIEASDDLGLTQVILVRNLNDSEDMRKELWVGDGQVDYAEVEDMFDLKDLGLRAGDIIDYYAIAKDSFPGAPQSAATASYRVVVISFQEYKEFVQTQMTAKDLREKYDAYMEEMKALAEEQKAIQEEMGALQNKAKEGAGLSDAEQERLEELAQMQQALAEKTKELAERMAEQSETPSVFDVEDEYKKIMKALSEALKEAAKDMEQASEAMDEAQQNPAQGLPSLNKANASQNEALKKLGESMGEFEEGVQKPGENLEHVTAVVGDVEQFKYLYTIQKGLERQVRMYSEMSDPSLEDQVRMKELGEQQVAVQDALLELSEKLREHADNLEKLGEEKGQVNPEEEVQP